jgi:spore coat protein U-like protein
MSTSFSKLAVVVAAMALSGGAMAADTVSGIGTIGVSATILNECSVGSLVPLAFADLAMLNSGAQSSVASDSIGGGTFDAICTLGSPSPKLRFTSANSVGSAFRMIGTDSTFIAYTLATSADVAIAYGVAAPFTGLTADGTAKHLTVKGSIAPSEKAAKKAQAYADTLTITSSFTLD